MAVCTNISFDIYARSWF